MSEEIGINQNELPDAQGRQKPEIEKDRMKGRVISVQGPVVDVKFDGADTLPALWDVLTVKAFDGKEVLMEIAEHLPNKVVRCIALSSTLNVQKNSFVY